MASKLIPILAYNRVSSEDQARTGHSLEIQPRRHAQWCKAMGYELIDVVCDKGVSAGKRFETRQGAQELMQRLEAGEARGMLVTRFDRAFRLAVDGLLQLQWFLDRDLIVTSIEMPIDLRTDWGWKVFAQQVVDAEYERRTIQSRARETTQGLIGMGKVYGPVPYGCTQINGQLYRVPETWAVRELIIQKREELSLRALCDYLRKEEIAPPAGGKLWHVSTVSNIIDSHHTLQHIPMLPESDDA